MDAKTAEQCFARNKLFVQRKSTENHRRICSSMLGITYMFVKQNILSFEIIINLWETSHF